MHRADKLALRSVTGRTSDEIWPELDYVIMSMFPGLRKRGDDAFSTSQGLDNVVSAGTLSATVPPPGHK